MPKMSDTMEEGVIAQWLKKEGEEVKSGDILAEVETDKATMELEAYEDGTLLHIGVKEGESVAIDGIIAVIGEKGADFQKLIDAESRKAKTPAPVMESASSESVVSEVSDNLQKTPVDDKPELKEEPAASPRTDGKIKASPLAKKLAKDLGYDLSKINGSGDFGRIIKRDVEAYKPALEEPVPASVAATAHPSHTQPTSQNAGRGQQKYHGKRWGRNGNAVQERNYDEGCDQRQAERTQETQHDPNQR